jgi:phosphomannomutase
VVVTASHNPPAYNGFKLVLSDGQPVTFATGLGQVMALMLAGHRNKGPSGQLRQQDIRGAYISYLKARFDGAALHSGMIALNGLNGTASTLAHDLAGAFALPVAWLRQTPGAMPIEGADPLMPRLQAEMCAFMQQQTFDLGVAWDGDCDRCVFFDGSGRLVPTYYIVGLLAQHYLQASPGGAIVFDTKLCWNTLDIIAANQGRPVRSETGHAFMKQHMRNSQALYGGELSSHHYFGDFFACDSGMIAWLKIIELLNSVGRQLGDIINSTRSRICCTPEINLQLHDPEQALQAIESKYGQRAVNIDHFDGLSFEMPGDWRFTLRQSKTESMVRLNLEGRGNCDRLLNEGAEVLHSLTPYQADTSDWQNSLFIQ